VDVPQVMRVRGGRGIAVHIPPFIDVRALRPEDGHDVVRDRVRFITVAMMRDGAKLGSYRVLAAALTRLPATGWELVIVGDGPARAQVQALFAAFAPAQVRMTGELPSGRIPAEMHQADVFVWPAVDEAFGMVFLEAQACGLPVVAGDSGGVRGVVDDGRSGWLVPAGDAGAFAHAMHRLLVDRDRRAGMGAAARRYVEAHHDLRTAARTLDALVSAVVAQHGSVAPDPKVSASC
jgi:glycosyltransferase involved in cell wall biosynthesis